MPHVAYKLDQLQQGVVEEQSLAKDRKKAAVKQQLSVEVLKASPYLLGKHILGFDRYCTPHKIWDKFARSTIDFKSTRSSKTLVLQPRECYKSTFWTVNTCINILINNPNASILIVSATGATSTLLLHQIKNHLASNEKLINTFGAFYNKEHWNSNSISISQKTNLNSKEPSVMAVGKGQFITGMHFDFIIWDDVVGPQDRISAAERASTLRYFQDCFDILKKDIGQFIVTGTRYHKEDIYNHILEINKTLSEESKFKTLITPAYNKETGELNFPTILTAKKLEELRQIKVGKDTLDFSSFSCQYLLEPIDSSEQVFKQFHYVDIRTLEFHVAIMFLDPAMSKTGCYSAAITIARIKNGEYKNKWMVIETTVEKRSPTKTMHDVINLHKFVVSTYGIECACYCEQNGFQALLKDNIMRQALEDGYSLPITGRTTTQNKEAKITGLEPYITQGHLLFRKDWQTASGGYKILMEQLKNFPQDEVDAVDALSMGMLESRSRYFNMDLAESSEVVQS